MRTALSDLLADAPELVCVHSCVASFVSLQASAETCLAAWIDSLPPTSTLVMPTFTFSFCQTRVFDPHRTPSETGALTEAFRLQEHVIRSHNPIYSVAALGPRAEEVTQKNGETCWGKGSVFELLEQDNALIVGFGVSLARAATVLHRPEECLRVPYRYCKTFEGNRIINNQPQACRASFWVKRRDLDVKNDFLPVIEKLHREGQCQRIQLGRSTVESAYAADICRVETEMLQRDPLAVLADQARVRAELAKTSIAFLGSANLDLLADAVREDYPKWDPIGIRTIPVPFGQYKPHLLQEDTDLRVVNPNAVVFLERLEDLCGETAVDPYGEGLEVFRENLEEYLAVIHQARRTLQGFFIILNFSPSFPSVLGSADPRAAEGLKAIADYGNRRLAEGLKDVEDVCVLDLAPVLSEAGIERRSRKYWYLGRIPFGRNVLDTLARKITGVLLARSGKTARLLVLDLDHTLWGGVIGEDGIEGIQLGGDYPGNAYRDFQRVLKLLKERGLALAIASKNTESVALEAIARHPEMVLKQNDFYAWRINWGDKASSIRSLCGEIGLGPRSVCFLDDSPNEREWVKAQLPDVCVPDLPEDPSERPQFLLNLPCLDLLEMTEEDRHRADQYQAEREIRTQRAAFGCVEDFYRNLDMVVTLCDYTPANSARVLQLISKTNQFNVTTRRYTRAQLEDLMGRGYRIYAVQLKDRFRREEIIGVLIVQWKMRTCTIDSFLLSCRVLGYGVETAVLGWLAAEIQKKGGNQISGEMLETPRNQIVRDLYVKHGFRPVAQENYLLHPLSACTPVPDWVIVKDHTQDRANQPR